MWSGGKKGTIREGGGCEGVGTRNVVIIFGMCFTYAPFLFLFDLSTQLMI